MSESYQQALVTAFLGGWQPLAGATLYSVTDLGTLGRTYTSGSAINNAGQITGQSRTVSGAYHAFLYSQGVMTDLNDLIDPNLHITLTDAGGINDNGQIVANGNNHAYLLTPVPEPGTWALLSVALLGCGFWVRARRV